MLDNSEITADQQLRWFKSLSLDKSKIYLVFFQDEIPIGMLYFSELNIQSCNWGCYIGEDAVWPGSGLILELAALDFAFNCLVVQTLRAEVLAFNTAPIKMHTIFGYCSDGLEENRIQRNGESVSLLKFSYKMEDWFKNRNNVLNKLPKQIRAAAEDLEFQI